MGSPFIENIDTTKHLADTSSCLEFLLASFCQNFALTSRQAAGLLTQGGKYLAHIIVKGLKGNPVPVLHWYLAVTENVNHLVSLVAQEQSNASTNLILASFKTGFIAEDLPVVLACARLFELLGQKLEDTWQWFISEGGGLEICLLASRQFGALIKPEIIGVISEFSKSHLLELSTVHLKAHLNIGMNYFATVTELIQGLSTVPWVKHEISNQGVAEYWVDLALKDASVNSADLRLGVINFVCEIWVHLPEFTEAREDLALSFLDLLKTGYRDRKTLMKYACLGKLFYLLQVFNLQRNPFAPTVYKTLTFSLVENYESLQDREFILSNFILSFKEIESIPVGILLDPLLKQLQLTPRLPLSVIDFDFFCTVAQHPRFNSNSALQLIDVLGKIIANNLEFASTAYLPFLQIIQRFYEDKTIAEYLSRLVQFSLKLLLNFSSRRYSKDTINKILKEENMTNQKFQLVQRNTMLRLVEKIIELGIQAINTRIKKELLRTNFDYKKTHPHNNNAILNMLKVFGNPSDMIEQFDRKLQDPLKIDKRAASLTPEKSMKKTSSNSNIARALQDIQKIKEKRNEKIKSLETQQRKEERRKMHLQQQPHQLVEYKEFYALLTSEEQDIVQKILKNYCKLLKYLFKKYSSTGYNIRVTNKSSFDSLVSDNATLTISEFYKMLKDHGVNSSMLAIDDFRAVARGYNSRVRRVNYANFKQLFTQTAIFIYSKPPLDMSLVEPALLVKLLLEFCKKNVHKFEDLDPGFGDRDVVLKLNSLLKTNPKAALPEGYKKVNNTDIHYHYYQPRFPKMKQSVVSCLEILDDFLHELFGFHILEPFVYYTSKYTAKGVLPKVVVAPSNDLSLNDKFFISDMGITYHKAQYYPRIPPELHVSAAIRIEMLNNVQKYPQTDLIETAIFLEDLLFSVSIASSTLVKHKPKVQNRVLQMKEQQRLIEIQAKAQEELKWKRRQEFVKEEWEKGKLERTARLKERERKKIEEQTLLQYEIAQKEAKRLTESIKSAEKVQQWKLQREILMAQRGLKNLAIREKDKDYPFVKTEKPLKIHKRTESLRQKPPSLSHSPVMNSAKSRNKILPSRILFENKKSEKRSNKRTPSPKLR